MSDLCIENSSFCHQTSRFCYFDSDRSSAFQPNLRGSRRSGSDRIEVNCNRLESTILTLLEKLLPCNPPLRGLTQLGTLSDTVPIEDWLLRSYREERPPQLRKQELAKHTRSGMWNPATADLLEGKRGDPSAISNYLRVHGWTSTRQRPEKSAQPPGL